MRRRLLNLLTALSLLLCVAVVTAAVRGFWTADSLLRRVVHFDQYGGMKSGGVFALSLQRGGIAAASSRKLNGVSAEYDVRREVRWSFGHDPSAPVPRWAWHFGRYQTSVYVDTDPNHSAESRRLFVPYWMLLVATGILPVRAATTAVKARRRKPGLCPSCGYDLRATPGRCPECGTDNPVATPDGTTTHFRTAS